MIDVLFRGQSESGKWLYGGVDPNNMCIVCGYQYFVVKPETIGRYTGLRDSKGTMVFEGDIIQHRDDLTGDSREVVIWSEHRLAFATKRLKDNSVELVSREYIGKYMEVVGNVEVSW